MLYFLRLESSRRLNVCLSNTPSKVSGLFWQAHVPNPELIKAGREKQCSDWPELIGMASPGNLTEVNLGNLGCSL